MISLKLNVLDNGKIIIDRVYNQDENGNVSDVTPQFDVPEEEKYVFKNGDLSIVGKLYRDIDRNGDDEEYRSVNNRIIEKLGIVINRAKHIIASKNLESPVEGSPYRYHPRNRFELEIAMNNIIEKEGLKANLNVIDVSRVTNFSGLFANSNLCEENRVYFNLTKHDVESNTDIYSDRAYSKYDFSKFNGDVSKWNTSNVTDMSEMFAYSSSNLDVSNWDTSKVVTMRRMFMESQGNTSLYISNWDVSNVENFSGMFRCEKVVSNKVPDLSKWDMSKAVDLTQMFYNCKDFKGTGLPNWNISNVTSISEMFYKCENFNAPIGSWNTSSLKYCDSAFEKCKNFNQNLNNWNMSKVKTAQQMFLDTRFNGSIDKWDVSNCIDFCYMFKNNPVFNIDISNWNMRSAARCSSMFENAKSFNQDLSSWRFLNSEVFSWAYNMFANCPASFDMNHWVDETEVPRAKDRNAKDDLEALLDDSNIQPPVWWLKALGKAVRPRKQKPSSTPVESTNEEAEEESNELVERILRRQKMSEDVRNILLRL